MRSESLKEKSVRLKPVTELSICTECEQVKLIAVSMELKPVPSIKKRICNDCLTEIDGSDCGFDWNLWTVK